MTSPTARQLEVLSSIQSFALEHGYPPTLRELGDLLDIASTNGVADHLSALEAQGLIERDPIKSRGMRILEPGFRAMEREVKS